jgi:hypothetical protein
VTSRPVRAQVLEYYLRLIPEADNARARVELLSPDDDSPRPLARKILERSELLARLAKLVPDPDPAFILPFNVRGFERDLALELDIPIYGIDHRFARYGTKTGARRLFESGSHTRRESTGCVAVPSWPTPSSRCVTRDRDSKEPSSSTTTQYPAMGTESSRCAIWRLRAPPRRRRLLTFACVA